MEQELIERLDFIEFRQELLFADDSFTRLLFVNNVTRIQHKQLLELFSDLSEQLDNGEEISSVHYENQIDRIVPDKKYMYHFAEQVAKTLHENERYEDVFVGLYGHADKFREYLSK